MGGRSNSVKPQDEPLTLPLICKTCRKTTDHTCELTRIKGNNSVVVSTCTICKRGMKK